jgi:hypothetical protein
MGKIYFCNSFECSDWVMLLLGFLLTIVWGFFIFSLKPNLYIKEPEISNNHKLHLKIPIENKSRFSTANKISIEAAVVTGENDTYHFDVDFKDFVFIPNKKKGDPVKIFNSYYPNSLTANIFTISIIQLIEFSKSPDAELRIRIHSHHEWTGLGSSKEQLFKFKNEKFIRIIQNKNNNF